NVGPGYTNIAVMGTYVTMVAGEQLGDDGLRDYAKQRLRRFHEATMATGSFSEYNSPTYTVVALSEITRMKMHFQDADDLKLVNELNHAAWKHTAVRFHPPTGQWAGPHSRSYRTLLSDDSRVFQVVEVATGLQKKISSHRPLDLGLDEYRLDYHCPDELLHHFLELKEPKTIIETFQKRSSGDVIGTTYLHPRYCLGSVNRGDFWVQRRPIIAYWGDRKQPRYLQVRFLHDGYDFCSALPFTAQVQNELLCFVGFANDYGDTHVSLDRIKNGTIKAKDLRLRFEFGGAVDDLRIQLNKSANQIHSFGAYDGDIVVTMSEHSSMFDKQYEYLDWKLNIEEKMQSVDVIFHHSEEEQKIKINRLVPGCFIFRLRIALSSEPETPSISSKLLANGIQTTVKTPLGEYSIDAPHRPASKSDLEKAVIIKKRLNP
ncbi:hypothetical protein K8I31_10820, partial [bacterium]|nr:hypothetical protein [bacterium]